MRCLKILFLYVLYVYYRCIYCMCVRCMYCMCVRCMYCMCVGCMYEVSFDSTYSFETLAYHSSCAFLNLFFEILIHFFIVTTQLYHTRALLIWRFNFKYFFYCRVIASFLFFFKFSMLIGRAIMEKCTYRTFTNKHLWRISICTYQTPNCYTAKSYILI